MKFVKPGTVNGIVAAPSSKSMMQRAVALATLCDSPTTITNPSLCEDGIASLAIARALGATVSESKDSVTITPGKLRTPTILNCNESGTSMRIFSALAALKDVEVIIDGAGSLKKRPMNMIEDALLEIGVSCKSEGGFPPIKIKGPLHGGSITVDGSESSQFISGLLIALPCCRDGSTLNVSNLKSRPYVEMTLEAIQKFGGAIEAKEDLSQFTIQGNQKYQGCTFNVEGDWSSASFLLVAGATTGEITVNNLSSDSLQADKAILTALDRAGAKVSLFDNSIHVAHAPLHSFEFNATHCPDLFPPLVALAASCKGTSTLQGVSRLFNKESNRALALQCEFAKLGIEVTYNDDTMNILGGSPRGAAVESHNDHRIAMACAVAALRSDNGIEINGAHCVAKSYPEFFDDLEKIRKIDE